MAELRCITCFLLASPLEDPLTGELSYLPVGGLISLTRSYSSFVLAVLQSDFPLFINCVLLVLVSNDMTGIWPPSPRENACDGPMHASTISFSARTSHGKSDLVSSPDQVDPHPRIKAPADECEPFWSCDPSQSPEIIHSPRQETHEVPNRWPFR